MTKDRQKSCCGVLNCLNNSSNSPNLSYFRIPKDPEKAAIWLEKIHRPDCSVKKVLVCEIHFEKRFVNDNDSRKRLVGHAVPTLVLPEKVHLECIPDLGANCPADYDDDADQDPPATLRPTKRNYTEEQQSDGQSTSKQQKLDGDDDVLVELLYIHNKMRKLSPHQQYTEEFKLYLLELYFNTPSTYKVMRPVMNLPSVSSLYRLLIPFPNKTSDNLMRALKYKVSTMTQTQKQCIVSVGSVPLTPSLHYNHKTDEFIGLQDLDGVQRIRPANRALIVMVRDLLDHWKQAVAVAFLSPSQDYKDVRVFIGKIIEQLFDLGLIVRVFMTDSALDNDNIFRDDQISVNIPYFLIKGHKVCYMHDPIYLLSETRDLLMNTDIQYNGSTVQWRHILKCYNYDSRRSMRLAPNLSAQVVHRRFESQVENVRAAAEVFSATTAAAISAYRGLDIIEQSGKTTEDFIAAIHNVYTILTGPNSTIKNKYKLLKQFVSLSSLHCVDSAQDSSHPLPECFKKLEITVSAFISLSKDLEKGTSQRMKLNRDSLETFVDDIGKKYGAPPTCEQLLTSFTKVPIIFNVFDFNKKQKSDNLHTYLSRLKLFSDRAMYCEREPAGLLQGNNETVWSNEHTLLQLCAQLLHEAHRAHSWCQPMRLYVLEGSGADDHLVMLNVAPTHNEVVPDGASSVMVVVPEHFRMYVESLELIFKRYLETQFERHPQAELTALLLQDKLTFPLPCQCFPLDLVKQLYAKYRIHILYKYNQLRLESEHDRGCPESLVVNVL